MGSSATGGLTHPVLPHVVHVTSFFGYLQSIWLFSVGATCSWLLNHGFFFFPISKQPSSFQVHVMLICGLLETNDTVIH